MMSIDMNTQLIDFALVSSFLTLNIFCFLFYFSYIKGTVMQIEKTLINDRLRVWQDKCSVNFKRQLEYA